MYSLTAAAILEKNKIASEGAEIVLLQIDMPDGETTLRLARNTENVTWNGYTWVAFPFDVGDMGEPEGGVVPDLTLKVGNVSRQIQSYMEEGDGGVGATMTLYVVNSNLLAETTPMLQLVYTLTQSTCNNVWATFTLGAPNLFRKRFPQNRVMNNYCRYRLLAQCKFVDNCDHSLTTCRTKAACSSGDSDYGASYDGKARTIIFGGFPGVGKAELDV